MWVHIYTITVHVTRSDVAGLWDSYLKFPAWLSKPLTKPLRSLSSFRGEDFGGRWHLSFQSSPVGSGQPNVPRPFLRPSLPVWDSISQYLSTLLFPELSYPFASGPPLPAPPLSQLLSLPLSCSFLTRGLPEGRTTGDSGGVQLWEQAFARCTHRRGPGFIFLLLSDLPLRFLLLKLAHGADFPTAYALGLPFLHLCPTARG